MSRYVSLIHFTEKQDLRDHYDLCGLSPGITRESSQIFNHKKTTNWVVDLFICKTHCLSGWEFEKQCSTDDFFLFHTHAGDSKWEMNRLGHLDVAKKRCIVNSSVLVKGQFTAGKASEFLMVDSSIIRRELAAVIGFPPEARIQFQSALPTDSCAWKVIGSIACLIGETLAVGDVLSSSIAVSYVKQALLSAILETSPNNFSVVPNYKLASIPRHILRATEYMYENVSFPITLVDIAENSHTSIRNLQLGFRKCYDTTPLRYLRMLRLAGARGDLLSIDLYLPWYSVAKKWGFTNSAAFSRYYRVLYQETPFQTSHRIKGLLFNMR